MGKQSMQGKLVPERRAMEGFIKDERMWVAIMTEVVSYSEPITSIPSVPSVPLLLHTLHFFL